MFIAMTTAAEDRSFQSKLEKLDLKPIKEKLHRSAGYKEEILNEMEMWYKRFLFLNFKYNESQIVPNDLIDEFWHFHILDTRKYATDCNFLFGDMLHHFPYFGMRGAEDLQKLNKCYEETKRTFLEEFGEIPFAAPVVQEILLNEGMSALQKASSCSDCSGAPGTGT